MLYHLRLLQILMKARRSNDLRAFHFALLRQLLENVASFLGTAQFAYVLRGIGINDAREVTNIINTLSHKKVYYYESDLLKDDSRMTLENVLDKLQEKYRFEFHYMTMKTRPEATGQDSVEHRRPAARGDECG